MTTKDQDKTKQKFVHFYLALRRKKENPDLSALCFRQIIIDDKLDLEILKLKLKGYPGVWRIHKTVNKRDCAKAAKILIHTLIDCPEKFSQIPSLWKTCLLKPESRGERNFLLDIDSLNNHFLGEINYILTTNGIINHVPERMTKTPNGYHLITRPFDPRILQDFKEVIIKRDGYLFLELYEQKTEGNDNDR